MQIASLLLPERGRSGKTLLRRPRSEVQWEKMIAFWKNEWSKAT